MRWSVAALAVVLLAGCAGTPSSPAGSGPMSSSADGAPATTAMVGAAASNASTVPRTLSWSDDLAVGAWACEGATQACEFVPDENAYGRHHEEDGYAGRLVGGNLTVTWTAATPATQSLSVGALAITPGCEACNSTPLGPDVSGPSPLSFPLPAGFAFEVGQSLQVWVYSSSYQAAGPVAAGASEQQAFTVQGDFLLSLDTTGK